MRDLRMPLLALGVAATVFWLFTRAAATPRGYPVTRQDGSIVYLYEGADGIVRDEQGRLYT